MRQPSVLLLLALALAAGCGSETPSVEEPPSRSESWYEENDNLLSLLRGVVVTERSGELSFEYAAMFAIDGQPGTAWSTPPRDLEQWMVTELPVRSRIDRVGLSNGAFATIPRFVNHVRFELSDDGKGWADVGTFSFEPNHELQLFDIDSRPASFMRITMLDNRGSPVVTDVPTLLATGDELDDYSRPSAQGEWQLNQFDAQFRDDGSRVFGHVAMDPPMLIDGAWHGRVVRFAWVRGRSYGVGIFTVNHESSILNGMWWYENTVEPGNSAGGPWYGRRLGDAADLRLETSQVAQLHIERDGRFPLFGLVFDDKGYVDAEASRSAIAFIRTALETFPDYRVRLVVNEFHSRNASDNMTVSEKLAENLTSAIVELGLPADRIVVNAYGSEKQVAWRNAPLHWEMYSRVDFALTTGE